MVEQKDGAKRHAEPKDAALSDDDLDALGVSGGGDPVPDVDVTLKSKVGKPAKPG